jgi:hypothetical protein
MLLRVDQKYKFLLSLNFFKAIYLHIKFLKDRIKKKHNKKLGPLSNIPVFVLQLPDYSMIALSP